MVNLIKGKRCDLCRQNYKSRGVVEIKGKDVCYLCRKKLIKEDTKQTINIRLNKEVYEELTKRVPKGLRSNIVENLIVNMLNEGIA